MSARQKLNAGHVMGSLILASFVGLATESVVAAIVSAIGLLVAAYYTGDIRLKKPPKERGRPDPKRSGSGS